MPDVWKLYETHARAFDRDRGRSLMEHAYLEEIVATLKPNARVMDLVCGAGEPIARFFIERGFDLTGVDAAPAMIAISKERFPDAKWVVADMRPRPAAALRRRHRMGQLLHLSRDEQRAMFAVFAKNVTPGGVLLFFTSGARDGEVSGHLYGNELYHASLAPDEYRTLLAASGFEVLRYREEDPECGGHTVWFAQAVK